MMGDQAYFMGRAAARLEGTQYCPFGADTAQGRSWRRGWREVRGTDHDAGQQPRTWEERAFDLLERLERMPRRGGSPTSKVVYWQVAEDYEVITLLRRGLEAAEIGERLGRTTYAVYDRMEKLRGAGFGPDMEAAPVAGWKSGGRKAA